MEDTPYTPSEDLWVDSTDTSLDITTEVTEIPSVPDWVGKPSVPATTGEPRCALAMCGDKNTHLLMLGCGHHLHQGCMSKILKATRYPECPMCHDGYLSRIRQIVESNPFTVSAALPPKSGIPIDPFTMPTDTYGPPDSQPPYRPPGATRYGEQFDTTPRGEPISYGGRFRHMDRHNANQRTAEAGPPPCQPIGKVNMMGLEARQFLR